MSIRHDDPSPAGLDADARRLLFDDARTANSFTSEPVNDAQLSEIWALAKWPPTASNGQPLRVVFIRTDHGKQRLAPHLSEANRAKSVAAPVIAVLAADLRFYEYLPTLYPHRPGRAEKFANDPDRDHRAMFNATLQAGYFLLAVRAVGLAAGPMTGFRAAGVDAEFFPEGRLRSVMLVNIGRPAADAWTERLPRLDPAITLDWA